MDNTPLNPANIPKDLVSLLPLAEKWGISDDGYRADAVSRATTAELESLVQAVDGKIYEILGDWLAANARNENLPKEYYALTSFSMAVESARVELENRRTPLKPVGDQIKLLNELKEAMRKQLLGGK